MTGTESDILPQDASAESTSALSASQREVDALLAEVAGLAANEDATVATTFVDVATVKRWLPPGLVLGAVPGVPAGQHPVLVLVSARDKFRDELTPDNEGISYGTFAVLVPNVYFSHALQKLKGAPSEAMNFMPTLYLDRSLPIQAGYYLGFAKHLGGIDATRTSWTVQTRTGGQVANVTIADLAPAGTPDQFPNFMALLQSFSPRYVGYQSTLGFICSEKNVDVAQLIVQPVQSRFDIAGGVLPGWKPAAIVSDGIDTNPLGAYRLASPFAWTAPRRCF